MAAETLQHFLAAERPSARKLQVRLSEADHDQILALATAHRVPVAQMARALLRISLEAAA
jgi:hypothetical protein